ncbi:MAG: hypothetical protein WC737_05765 [Parcubacteria group bacterium]|jgi:hypothetical protein
MAKTLTIKSFNSSGTFIKIITDATFDSFSKVINGGIGDLTLKLARKIDSFNSNSDVSIGNRIEIWVYDEDTGLAGTMIYNGYIEQQNPIIDGGDEYVELVCFGIISKLNNDLLKTGSQTTLYTETTDGLTITALSIAAAEIATVLKKIIDYFNAANTTFPIYYNLSGTPTIEDTGNDMNYTFEALTYSEAIERCRGVAPQDWYWFLDSDGQIYFKAPSSSADHDFVIGKDIKSIKASKSADSIKNIILVWDGAAIYKEYKDDVSISLYGRRVKLMVDSKIEDATTMDNIGNAELNESKDPKIRIELEIIDNNESAKGYDIESIQPGDTCRIIGVDADESIFDENMIIKEVIWSPTKATLVIETEKIFDINRYILDIDKKLNEQITLAIPETYT